MFDFSSFPNLTTARLRLRQLTPADAEAVIALFSAPEVVRFLNQPPTDTPEKAVGLIDWLNGQFEKQAGVNWGITLLDDPCVIGICGCDKWQPEDRRVDIGYHITPAYWGRGYATEAAHAVIAWCFEYLDVHRVQADCTEGNSASERVLLKCGFTFEGLWRESCWEHGRFVNIKQFGLLRREYPGG
jgi:ribosomal-protein-alanine N-acetyltransferase